jgi:nucleotide-binding universal stress UspA family protein
LASDGAPGYERLLVPIDFADHGRKIIGAVRRVLAPHGSATLLHVVEALPAVTEGTFGIYPHRKDIEKIKELAHEKLEGLVQDYLDMPLQTRVREGKPATVILEEIAEQGADLVVMGTHGRTHLDHLMLGSVAERVLRRAPCPVLVVRS